MFILNGKLVDEKDACVPLCDHGLLYGDGIYETLRTVNGNIWLFGEHMKRLKESAELTKLKVPFTDAQIKKQIQSLIKANKINEARIRITLTRGCNGFNFLTSKNPTIIIEAKNLILPDKKLYREGAKAVTYKITRPLPQVKSISMLSSIIAYQEAQKQNAYEALLVNERGEITEASMSNVFAIKGKTLYTPNENILEGTVRNHLIKLLKNKFIIKYSGLPLKKLYDFDEIFITSTIKGVIPIVEVNNRAVNKKQVGPKTSQIIQIFANSLE